MPLARAGRGVRSPRGGGPVRISNDGGMDRVALRGRPAHGARAREGSPSARRTARIRDQFSHGALSYAKVKALTRVADSDSEELLELAHYATASQLERMLRAYRRIGADEARDTHEGEYLAWSWGEDGSLTIRGRLAAEDSALLLRALEAARDRQWREGHDDEGEPSEDAKQGGPAGPPSPTQPRAHRITNVEALVEMADASLSPQPVRRSAPERYQVVVHVDHAALARDADGRSELEGEAAISPETTRRLACDSSVVSILERDGAPLRIGRKTRKIPPALGRALRARDGGCQTVACASDFRTAGCSAPRQRQGEIPLNSLAERPARS